MIETPPTALWAIHPQPQANELFESWLLRCSLENTVPARWIVENLQLEHIIAGIQPISAAEVQLVASALGIYPKQILKTHFGTVMESSKVAYSTPYSVPAREKTKASVQCKVCPKCLSEMAKPYIKIPWVLQVTAFCNKHYLPLSEHCPQCQTGLEINLMDRDAPIQICKNCGFDYRKASTACFELKQAVEFQEWFLSLKTEDTVHLAGRRMLTAKTFVGITERLIRQLIRVSCSQVFINFCDLQLLDDRFSDTHRRANALILCAWVFANPDVQISKLIAHTRQYADYGVSVRLQKAFLSTLESIRMPNARVM
ncbi:MAG: hypothetical protein RLZZ156_1460 [Deinococcota bacterium]|jgi:hypothetical protein